MSTTIACITGEEVHRQWDTGRITGEKLTPRQTPFGQSGELFLIEANGQRFYLLGRYGQGMDKTAPRKINDRANMYALKYLGVQYVLGWGPGGAITHNIAVGELMVLSDVIDYTYLRNKTFFEDSPLGFLRQFPVFCPTLRRAIGQVLDELRLLHHDGGTAAVREGPRLETPAEVRTLAATGAEVVTHTFVPEVFLAKELELCYAGICYVVNYAETGSRHRPFATGELFGNLRENSEAQRLAGAAASISQIVARLAEALQNAPKVCECDQTMAYHREQYHLPDDWRKWFA